LTSASYEDRGGDPGIYDKFFIYLCQIPDRKIFVQLAIFGESLKDFLKIVGLLKL